MNNVNEIFWGTELKQLILDPAEVINENVALK